MESSILCFIRIYSDNLKITMYTQPTRSSQLVYPRIIVISHKITHGPGQLIIRNLIICGAALSIGRIGR